MSDKAAVSSVTAADSVYRQLRLCVVTPGVCNVKNAKLLYQLSSYTVNYASDGEHIVLFYYIHYIELGKVKEFYTTNKYWFLLDSLPQ